MIRLEEIQPQMLIRGLHPSEVVTIIAIDRHSDDAIEVTYKDSDGKIANGLLYKHNENQLEIINASSNWPLDGDGHLFRLLSEAHRIRLAHLFDPHLAVHTSIIKPLPHQITAVYESMLPRQTIEILISR